MADLNKLLTPLFLNEGEIRKIIELLFFSYRDFTEGPDKVLEKINFGRAHHRVIYFVGKQKNLTIKELLSILKITKQSLSRVLNQLVNEKYIILSVGKDKRTKKLILSKKGKELEKRIEKRFLEMLKNGAIEEAKKYRELGLSMYSLYTSNKIIGLEQIASFIDKKISMKELKEAVFIKTRQYAKRQYTWQRGQMKDWKGFSDTNYLDLRKKILSYLSKT